MRAIARTITGMLTASFSDMNGVSAQRVDPIFGGPTMTVVAGPTIEAVRSFGGPTIEAVRSFGVPVFEYGPQLAGESQINLAGAVLGALISLGAVAGLAFVTLRSRE